MSAIDNTKAGMRHIGTPIPRGTLEKLSRASSGSLTTELFRRGLKQCFLIGLKPMNPNAACFAGEAFTMRFIPTREDIDTYATLTPYPNPDNLQWEAVEQIGAGQVLVIDSRNDMSSASAGTVLATRMMVKGCAGIVTDGALRDGREYGELNFPAYARGVVASTRLSTHHAADLQVPIACAGVAVYPGDIVVGDGDGITIVPRHMAVDMADACEKRDAFEAYLTLRIASGEGLYGVYPPTEAVRADYAKWVAAGSRPADVSNDPRMRRTDMTITPEHMEREIRRYFAACNAGNYEQLMSCFTPDAVHYFPRGLAGYPLARPPTRSRKNGFGVSKISAANGPSRRSCAPRRLRKR